MKKRVIIIAALILLLAAAAFVYFRFYFVFGDGVKAGDLNQITYKGYVWKTLSSTSPSKTRKWPTT